MSRHEKARRILDLLDRPKDSRTRGMANLQTLTDSDLDVLLHDVERDTKDMANVLYGWLKPAARDMLFSGGADKAQSLCGPALIKPKNTP
jgi:hypothetical protein